MEERNSLAKRIKKLRKTRGLTQKQFEVVSGIPYSTLAKIEAGVIANPSIPTLKKLSKGLKITLDKLLEDV